MGKKLLVEYPEKINRATGKVDIPARRVAFEESYVDNVLPKVVKDFDVIGEILGIDEDGNFKIKEGTSKINPKRAEEQKKSEAEKAKIDAQIKAEREALKAELRKELEAELKAKK